MKGKSFWLPELYLNLSPEPNLNLSMMSACLFEIIVEGKPFYSSLTLQESFNACLFDAAVERAGGRPMFRV